MSLVLLNLAGGRAVDDLKKLQVDERFRRVLERCELHGRSRKEKREISKRGRKEKRRSVPSASAVFRYLEAFHDESQKAGRVSGKA